MAGGMQPNVGLGAGIAPTNSYVGTLKPSLRPVSLGEMQGNWDALKIDAGNRDVPARYRTVDHLLQDRYDLGKYSVDRNDPKLLNRDALTDKSFFTSSEIDELKEEYANQEKILAAQRQQFAELAAGSGTPQPRGAGSVNVGSRGPIQINPLNPVAQIKQPDILTGPFLGRWRR